MRKYEPAPVIALAHVFDGSERQFVRRLRRAGIESFAPRLLEFPARGAPTESQLFPGYAFVWPNDRWPEIRRTPGFIHFVMSDGYPAFVPHALIKEIRSLMNEYGFVVLEERPRFRAGQRVRIREGTGVGVCVGRTGAGRVRVLLDILGGKSVEMELRDRDLVAA